MDEGVIIMKTNTMSQMHSTRWIKMGLTYVIWLLILTAAFAVIWFLQNKPSAQDRKYNGAHFVYSQSYTEDTGDPYTDAYLPAVQSQHHV